VVHRGLRDRSGDVKKRAARIVGNLCALINDPKDMAPYVGLLMPQLQAALVDPLPEVRATAARALGSLTGGMGEGLVGDTTPWLLETMRSEGSAVERSGAAQGLAECLAVRGAGALPAVLPEVLAGCRARSAAAREGSLTLFKYLPYCLPHGFQPYLPDVLPFVLGGLADEAEGVRDAALAAGRVAVELYAAPALPLLLPTVEAGAANENWRIRQSSVELLGDLLFKAAGATGKIQQDTSNEEDEGISVEAHGQAIVEALGMER
jgi:HEAT repeat protein